MYPRVKGQVFSSWAPRGIVTIATVLKQEHDVRILDSSFDVDLSRTKYLLKKFNPDFVLVSISSDLTDNVSEIVSFAKSFKWKVIVGGPFASISPKEVLRVIPEIDFLVVGEAEEVVPKLVKGKKLPGVYYKKGKSFVFTGKPNFIEDLDRIPIPDYSLLPTVKRYFSFGTATTLSSRGCPYRCSFCQPVLKQLFGDKMRFRSAESVFKEVIYLNKTYGINEIYFIDDTFGLNKEFTRRFVELLEKSRLKLKFLVNTRANLLDEDFASLLKRMNCSLVCIGVESGSQKILDNLDKDLKIEQIVKAFDICKKYGLRTLSNMMLNSPGETKQTLEESYRLIKRIKPTTLYLSLLVPYPGTYLYEHLKTQGLLLHGLQYDDFNCRKYDKHSLPINNPDLSYEHIDEFRKRVFRQRRFQLLLSVFIFVAEDVLEAFKTFRFGLFFRKQFQRAKIFLRTKSYFG